MTQRQEQFEAMLQAVQQDYRDTVEQMERLKQQGMTKSATYRQLMGNKLSSQKILTLYQLYGLIDRF